MSDSQQIGCAATLKRNVIKVGSRKSELALIQTKHVISQLKAIHPNQQFEIVTMSTLGDKILDIPLPKIGEKSLFTKELELSLEDGSIDFVVHSLKDLPTILPDGMAIGAVLEREDPRDALVLKKGLNVSNISSLSDGSVIGTSSLRRCAQLSKKYPNLKVENIRGNLNTRLKKLDELNVYSAIILARSGLSRMGWQHRINQVFDYDEVMYAVGQGALAVECRQSDDNILNLLKPLNDLETILQIIAERSFLKTLGGGCSAPVAVSCSLNFHENSYKIDLKGAVWSLNGQTELVDESKFEITFNSKNKRFKPDTKCDEIEDCVNACNSCPYRREKPSPSPTNKKTIETKIFIQDRPRESKCPINYPIGSEFMGKCPYLDLISNSDLSEDTDYFQLYEGTDQIKCPFILEFVSKKKSSCSTSKVSKFSKFSKKLKKGSNFKKLYCGIILHDDAHFRAYEDAELLGRTVADKLLEKGAQDIMDAAKNIVHSKA